METKRNNCKEWNQIIPKKQQRRIAKKMRTDEKGGDEIEAKVTFQIKLKKRFPKLLLNYNN